MSEERLSAAAETIIELGRAVRENIQLKEELSKPQTCVQCGGQVSERQHIAELERELRELHAMKTCVQCGGNIGQMVDAIETRNRLSREKLTLTDEVQRLEKENGELRAKLKLPKKVILDGGNIAKATQDAARAESKAQHERYGKDWQ